MGREARVTLEQTQAPDPVLIKRRHVSPEKVAYAKDSAELLREHGQVDGTLAYPSRHRARWRAQYLIDLLVDLQLFQRWELSEHTGKRNGGYVWSVEFHNRRRHG